MAGPGIKPGPLALESDPYQMQLCGPAITTIKRGLYVEPYTELGVVFVFERLALEALYVDYNMLEQENSIHLPAIFYMASYNLHPT